MAKINQSLLIRFKDDLTSSLDPFATFSDFLRDFTVKGYSYGFAVLRAEMYRKDRTKSVFFTHRFPSQWQDEITDGPLLGLDTAINLLLEIGDPYNWIPPDPLKVIQDFPKIQRRKNESQQDLGMNYCLSLPLYMGSQGFSGMSLWFENQNAAVLFRTAWADYGPVLMAAGQLLDVFVRKDHPNLLIGISKREIECLSLLLAGYRATEICWRLDISEKTLEKHILHARTKLKSHTRDQALVKAVLLGLIDI